MVAIVIAILVVGFIVTGVMPSIKAQTSKFFEYTAGGGGKAGATYEILMKECKVWRENDFIPTTIPVNVRSYFTRLGLGTKGLLCGLNVGTVDDCALKCAHLIVLDGECAKYYPPTEECYKNKVNGQYQSRAAVGDV